MSLLDQHRPDIFSPEATKKEIDELHELPNERVQVGVVMYGREIGVEGSASKDIGKPGGWFVAAKGTLTRTKKRVAAMIGWQP